MTEFYTATQEKGQPRNIRSISLATEEALRPSVLTV